LNPLVLDSGALGQPWRLWTCHLLHFSLAHAFLNLAALALPFLLAGRRLARRAVLWLGLAGAPLLSLALLPALEGGQYRGASGLACAAWAMVGLTLALGPGTRLKGALLLGPLALKLILEGLGVGTVLQPAGWQVLPAAHLYGALLGCLAALVDRWVGQPA